MSTFDRPALANCNIVQLSEHLRAAGIASSVGADGTGAHILTQATAQSLDAALASFVNDANWKPPLPGTLPNHVGHLQAYLAATPVQIAALTQAQKDHVLQDVVLALKTLIDSRLA